MRQWLRTAPLVAALVACSSAGEPEGDEETEAVVRGCGVERWAVKTGTDVDASQVDTTPVDATVSSLAALAAPARLPSSHRVPPTEEQTFRLANVTLVKFKLEPDGDIHMILSDGATTMDAEIPSPSCVGASSPFTAAIASARAAMVAEHPPSRSFTSADEVVTVVGVGFFDVPHGQAGGAPNSVELHPVVGVCFGQDCAP